MPQEDPAIKNLRIKTGVVKRLTKEKKMYEKEADELNKKIEQMKNEGKDEHDIKKQTEVKNESLAMVPDSIRRLKVSYDELMNLLEAEQGLSETTQYKEAKEVLQLAAAEIE